MDGTIAPWANYVLLAWVIGAGIYAIARFGMVPKREHLRDQNSVPFMAPWSLLSSRKWTPEGVAFNRRFLAFVATVGIVFVALWILLDLLTS